MKRWYNRKPETMQDWLLLFAVAAALLAAVWYLPAIAAALWVLLGLATPFAGGKVNGKCRATVCDGKVVDRA